MNYIELNNIHKEINKWYTKKTKVLNIISRPFNTKKIFSKIITKALGENKKILYVLCQRNIRSIEKIQGIYIKELLELEDVKAAERNIKFISVDLIKEIKLDYDIVIFDDITIFSNVDRGYIRSAIEEIYWRSIKIIVYSCERVFPIGQKLELKYLKSKEPIIEPRVITTRLKLEEDIPLTLFEYLKWFNENNKVTLIITPTEDMLNRVYSHYYKVLKLNDMRVVKYINGQSYSFIEDILDSYKESLFIVTNNIGNYINNISDVNLIVLFADDTHYSYKKLVYLCATINKENNFGNEVIFVAKDSSDNIELSKKILRGFNRILWEKN